MESIVRKIIKEQINLLFESFEMDNDKKTYVPNDKVAKTAQIALQVMNRTRQNAKSLDETGNEGSGKLKAKQLSQKTSQSFAEMKRLKSFFESNSLNVEEERKKIGIIQQRRGTVDEIIKSNILLVWNLHGGDAGKDWVTTELEKTHKQGNNKKSILRKSGGAYNNNGMGVFKIKYDPSQQRIHR